MRESESIAIKVFSSVAKLKLNCNAKHPWNETESRPKQDYVFWGHSLWSALRRGTQKRWGFEDWAWDWERQGCGSKGQEPGSEQNWLPLSISPWWIVKGNVTILVPKLVRPEHNGYTKLSVWTFSIDSGSQWRVRESDSQARLFAPPRPFGMRPAAYPSPMQNMWKPAGWQCLFQVVVHSLFLILAYRPSKSRPHTPAFIISLVFLYLGDWPGSLSLVPASF